MKSGKLHQGRIRMARGGFNEAFVASGTIQHDILIQGAENLNRVVDGDIYSFKIYLLFDHFLNILFAY